MNEEKKRFKYENNLKYRERVNKKIRRRTDKQYDKKLKKLQFEEKSLSEARLKVIKKLQEARWEPLYKKNIIVNRTEGKIRINGTDYLFENIGNTRLITNISNSTVTSGRVKTKFKPSIGGALAGGSLQVRQQAVSFLVKKRQEIREEQPQLLIVPMWELK